MSKSPREYLLSLNDGAFKAATQARFLEQAGNGTLQPDILARWLSQDRLYAQGYIRFIGHMLSKIRLPDTPGARENGHLLWRITDVLIAALVNVRRELQFFEETAARFNIDLTPTLVSVKGAGHGERQGEGEGIGASPVTRAYLDLFNNAASPSASILEGMVALWATEICYYTAWRYAGSHKPSPAAAKSDDPLHAEFIPNWTNDEFAKFVDDIGVLVDEMGASWKHDEDERKRCEEVWKQVLWLEERFWPVV
ncbi:heme oxygenase-like protein [Xylona heveae TC161]|uniref:Heme oxygenase-like protein n=1 Tax=Xylona heveae (strain CBS 132557 / TC161) TaxID=1328760 RepID=A0A161TQ89_XYLHT|nr:heme oxygenase-like protein [Xylona heveae TC161]KZF24476.1 heme oxygenase-like protein [Xylona heveae TC161]